MLVVRSRGDGSKQDISVTALFRVMSTSREMVIFAYSRETYEQG